MVYLWLLQPLLAHPGPDVIAQDLQGQGKQPQLPQQQRYGYPIGNRAG